MKKILYSILMVSLLLITATSCKDTFEDNSVITYYVDLQLKGDSKMWLEVNTPFNDPGVIATENKVDVSDKTETEGTVDTSTPGYYVLNYTVMNKDGFPASTKRQVFVYDPNITADYSGTYSSEGKRTVSSGVEAFGPFSVKLNLEKPGFYEFSDFLGGYYEFGRKYGEKAALKGCASIDNNGNVKGHYSFIEQWGDSASSISGKVNADGTIDMVVEYAGMKFEYKLTKN